MKKLFVVTFGILSIAASAQQKNSIKVNPASLFLGGGDDLVTYERAITEHSSVGISGGYGEFKLDNYKYYYTGGSVLYRYYTKEALKGLYFSGTAGFGGGRASYKSSNIKGSNAYTAFNIGALAGYQWVFNSGFTIDVNAGASYVTFNYKHENKMPTSGKVTGGVLPTVGVGLGYSF
ncbi:hypothetical protein QE422_002567 [Chryseobacterium sp. SORGH_AS 447]|uniref:DUF3575 domain-containing protein n=1 Tax=Chryseobacterium sp. SORGH_AS_0447 TaxID=3041769 RepID=UPI00277F7851|nr:DUF3575 domain-containing protein [Chryseobacterium sp. SORGH_AS_0447]MDQ1162199.1 hypothetical protein [Chryseobacterium sp. SORGH_AS_0447]